VRFFNANYEFTTEMGTVTIKGKLDKKWNIKDKKK
jgi:hypothetical protein